MDAKLSMAIGVASTYAAHLHRDDGVAKADAIRAAAAAVVRAARARDAGLGQGPAPGAGPAGAVPSAVPAVLVGAGALLLASGNIGPGMVASGLGWVIQILRT